MKRNNERIKKARTRGHKQEKEDTNKESI